MAFRWQLSEYKSLTLWLYLQQKSSHSDNQWTESEVCALIDYVALYHAPNEDGSNVWPIHKGQDFWENCSLAVTQCTGKSRRSCKCNSVVTHSMNLFFSIQYIFHWVYWIYITWYIIWFYIFLQYLYKQLHVSQWWCFERSSVKCRSCKMPGHGSLPCHANFLSFFFFVFYLFISS